METPTERPTLQIKVPHTVKITVLSRPPKHNRTFIKYKPSATANDPNQKPFKIWSQSSLQDYLVELDELEDVEKEIEKVQFMLRYLDGPCGLKEKKEDPHQHAERMKQSTQLFRALLWQKANWPNQCLPPNWLGIGSCCG